MLGGEIHSEQAEWSENGRIEKLELSYLYVSEFSL